MLDNSLTKFQVPLASTLDFALLSYANNKEMLDAQLGRSFEFDYYVLDTFSDIGNKAPIILAQNAIFMDCGYLHKDLYEIVYELALVLMKHNYGLFVLVRERLNQTLVYIRDELDACGYVPEIDIVFKD